MTMPRILAVLATVAALAAGTSCSSEAPLASDPDDQVAATGDAGAGDTASDDGAGDGGGDGSQKAAERGEGDQGAEPAKSEHKTVPVERFVRMMKRGYDGVSTAHMRMRVGGLQPMIAEGDMRLDPDDQAMDMTIESPQLGGKARLILVDDVVYFGLPDLPKGMFVAADPNDPDDRFGQIAAGLLEQVSVEQSYLAFGQALRRVVYLGPDAVAGTPADRYRMVIDAKQALRAQGEPVPPGMPAIFSSDMWLDGQGRGVRVSTDVGGIVVLTTMSDWNEPISIQAPPRGKIVQLP